MSFTIIEFLAELITPLCALILFLTMVFSTSFTVYIIFRDYIEPMLFTPNPNVNQIRNNERLVYSLSAKVLEQEKLLQKQKREIARLFNV